MNYDLIVLDMDGTLLNGESKVSDENRRVLELAVKKNVQIAIATGRIFTSARSYAELLGIYTPIIACNGGLIRNYSDLEILYKNSIAKADALEVIRICNQHKIYFHIYDADNLYVEEAKLSFLEEMYWKGRKRSDEAVSIVLAKEMESYLTNTEIEALKFVIVDEDPERLKLLRRELEAIPTVDVDKSWFNNLEVMNKGVSKGKAIARLAKQLNIPKDRIIAFGDNYNDISMKEAAGTFVAMGNAEEPVKQRADYITTTNNENGVAAGIMKLVFKED